MRSQYKVLKGGPGARTEVESIPGVVFAAQNPFGAGSNIIEIEHNRDPEQLPTVVKDQTVGNVILEHLKHFRG